MRNIDTWLETILLIGIILFANVAVFTKLVESVVMGYFLGIVTIVCLLFLWSNLYNITKEKAEKNGSREEELDC